jgi:hypothetical protein
MVLLERETDHPRAAANHERLRFGRKDIEASAVAGGEVTPGENAIGLGLKAPCAGRLILGIEVEVASVPRLILVVGDGDPGFTVGHPANQVACIRRWGSGKTARLPL